MTVHGTLTANGLMTPLDSRDGGGSGSSILIACQTFGGSASGLLSAKGGNGGTSGGGGGGRIAFHYQQLGSPVRVRMTAARGSNNFETNLIDTKEPFACTDGTIMEDNTREAMPDAAPVLAAASTSSAGPLAARPAV